MQGEPSGSFLVCQVCGTAAPVVDGFARFCETGPLGQRENFSAMSGDPEAYARFVEQAWRRPAFEPYAAFAPFNEATRALYPLIEALRAHLKPDDLIVDVWCRTGWTGALLAGLFPAQHIVSLWEGPSGVLGYAGFRHWLADGSRPANWTIAFADPRRGLPFADDMVALLHAADSLHRFGAEPFLDECLRVTAKDGALVFPHVHLSNSEPDPFFDRGGTIHHGLDYRRWLDRRLAASARKSFVLSERALFARKDTRLLADESGTPDYNALILVLGEKAAPFKIGAASLEAADTDRLILNPLVAVDSARGEAVFDPGALAGRAEYLLKRHPVYAERLAQCLPLRLTADELRILYWLRFAPELTLCDIQQRSGLEETAFRDSIHRLTVHEIAHAAPVGAGMAALQHFYATRRQAVALHDQQFAALWQQARQHYAGAPLIQAEDGSAFGFDDVAEILALLTATLQGKGVGPGRPLAILAAPGAEAILAIWAAWLLGAAVAPLDPSLPAAALSELVARVAPALALAEPALLAAVPKQVASFALATNTDGPAGEAPPLADALAEHEPLDLAGLAPVSESAMAAILFTSGSTGQPKGVMLSQGALWRGAQAIAEGLGWQAGDVLLSPGGLHTMSGLRNPCVAAPAAGAAIVLCDPRRTAHPATLAEACRRWQVTLLAAVPALVGTVTAAMKSGPLRFGALRQVAVTGSMLSQALQAEGERAFGAPVQVYYGLTETGGVCLLVPPGSAREADGDVGVGAGALARIADEAGNTVPPGATGELQIYSANLTSGYLGDAARSAALFDRGWLRTGDQAQWSGTGHVILQGRKDEQIKNRFGEIVQPVAIEALLCRRPDVVEAAVVGIGEGPDLKIAAFVVPKPPGGGNQWLTDLQAETLAALGPRHSPDRYVERAALPRLSSGKIARRALGD